MDSALLAVVPAALWWPLAVAFALPAAMLLLLATGGPSRALASRLAIRSAAVLSLGFALLVAFASLTVFQGGLEELGERPPEGLAQLGDDLGVALAGEGDPVDRLLPRLVLAQSADARVRFAAVVRLECPDDCLLAATPALTSLGRDAVVRVTTALRAAPLGATRVLVKVDRLPTVLMLGAVRDAQGTPTAIVALGVQAVSVARRATQLAWQLLGVALVLSLITIVLTRHGYAVIVADRVRALIDTLAARRGEEDQAVVTPPAGAVRSGGDELQLLAERIDGWIERSLAEHRAHDEQLRALEAQLTQAQKMEAIGRLSGGIAHDFNNLLTVIRANVQLLDHVPGSGERRAIDDAAARGAALVRKLLAFSRADVLEPRPIALSELLDGIAGVLRRVVPESITLEWPADRPAVAAIVDPTAFEQMLLNIVVNARDAMPNGGRIRIEAAPAEPTAEQFATLALAPSESYLAVRVRDTGVGMPANVVARVFEPFFTTKPPESGSGLGLAIVYGMMRQQRGAVEVESEPGLGTSVTLWIPARPLPSARAAVPELVVDEVAPLLGGSGRILLVEDEGEVRVATARALGRLGYAVQMAEHGAQALSLLTADPDAVDLIVSDMMMPVMGGLELWRALRERDLATPILFISGYSTESITQATKGDPTAHTLSKPWTVAELGVAVRDALDGMRVAS